VRKHLHKFGLGTVQFGLDYGISNIAGRPPLEDVRTIIKLADEAGFKILDTAPSYGDSEERLGACEVSKFNLKIVTKTPVFADKELTKSDGDHVYQSVQTSLARMKIPTVHGVLVHHADTLFKRGKEHVVDALLRLKADGLITKMGVSVYDSADLDRVLNVFEPEIVQLPLNVLDQRMLASGDIANLKKRNVEIHVRSLYLQGLLLMDINSLPKRFTPLKATLQRFHQEIASTGLSPLEGCLLFGQQIEEVDSLLLGIATPDQLRQIIESGQNIEGKTFDFNSYAEQSPTLLNPANWHAN